MPSWTSSNNFRQNDQGGLGDAPGPGLTVGGLEAVCEGPPKRLPAAVSNRGASFLDAGVEVIFRQMGGSELCRLRTADPVGPGACSIVERTAPEQAEDRFEAVLDPDAMLVGCIESNHLASGDADCLL